MSNTALLEIGRAARILAVSTQQVGRWVEAGKLDAIRTEGGQRLFKRSAVEALARDRAKNPPRRGRPTRRVA
jgi:excisionase family DNA binding protein